MSLRNAVPPEIAALERWLGRPPRRPDQPHGVGESDSEIIPLGPLGPLANGFLAATVDSVAEEIALGLYRDPFTMGWVCAQASLSDLAAVGAKPLGLLFSAQFAPGASEEHRREVARGFHEALAGAGTHLLGGDTGSARSTVLTSVGLGLCGATRVSRVGLVPGDVLVTTGKTGTGPALSFRYLRGEEPEHFPEEAFRPVARLGEGAALAELASAMMDTSDGLLATLDFLGQLNGVGFELEWNPDTLDESAIAYCARAGLPSWLLWVGEHGDFELLAGIPEARLAEARARCPGLHAIGRVVEGSGATMRDPATKMTRSVDFGASRALASGSSPDRAQLARMLDELGRSFKSEGYP